MDLQQLATALMGSVTTGPNYGNVNTTATNGAEMANIQALGGLEARGDAASRAVGALGAGAQAKDEDEKAQAQIARQRAAAEAEAQEKELSRLQDPDEYKAIVNDAGGYDFYDPSGNKIPAVEYARKKNIRVTDVYKDSQDPNDKDFINDYKLVTELGKAVQSGDKKTRDKIFKENPEFKNQYGSSTLEDIVKDLHEAYPGYFRSNQELRGVGGDRAGRSLSTNLDIPGSAPETDPRSIVDKAKDALKRGDSKSFSKWW